MSEPEMEKDRQGRLLSSLLATVDHCTVRWPAERWAGLAGLALSAW